MSGATRYINTSERTTALCEGLSLYGVFMNSRKHDPDFETKEDAWHAWIKKWSPGMVAIVQTTHDTLWTKASAY